MSDAATDHHPTTTAPTGGGQYWSFFWPLSLMGLAMVLARQCQNGALGRFENSTEKLAIFAYAWSTFHLFNSPVIFIPQMANALARTAQGRRKCLMFTLTLSVMLTVPVLVLGFSAVGPFILPRIFPLDDKAVASVVLYLRYLSPLIIIHGLRQHFTGLLVQSRRTGLVTGLQIFSLAIVLGMLILGLHVGWSAVRTLALAQVASAAATMIGAAALESRFRRPPMTGESGNLTYRRIIAFFWPVAMTSVMFSLSRPILYSFAGRGPGGPASVAALRVAGDLAMIFQSSLNQFRNLFVTFGREDLPGVRRFMVRMWMAVTVIMVTIVATPISTWIFGDLLGVEPQVVLLARQVLAVLCLAPTAITIRNYFHGIAMTGRSTLGMAAGGICRVALLWGGSVTLYRLGWMNHIGAAGLLVGGFAVEAAIVIFTLALQRTPPEAIAAALDQEMDN